MQRYRGEIAFKLNKQFICLTFKSITINGIVENEC